MTRRQTPPSTAPAEGKGWVPAARPSPLVSLTKRTLVHELQVHQVELEQQNEELLRAHRELVAVRDRFIDLFDFAPVAYLTLDRDGRIVEANLTAAAEFGIDRSAMLSRPFVQLVATPDADRWQRVAERAFRRKELMHAELLLLRGDGTHFQAEMDCRRVARLDARAQLRVTLTDVSQRRLAEKNQRIAAGATIARGVERRALALRLHEGLGQRLAALKLHLSALTLPKDATNKRTEVAAMAAELDEAMGLVRQMSTDLHPLMLDDLGLGAALDWLTRDVAVRLGLRTELHVNEDTAQIDAALALSIYRLTEQALTHFAQFVVAGISIELVQRPRDLVLLFQCVPGFARSDAPPRSMMALPEAFKDQVHLLGGQLMFSELPGGIHRVGVSLGVLVEERAGTGAGAAAGLD